ncbi:MAG: hypothetical protein Q9157_002869 [Trypethelium eluteriae]
MLSAPFQLAESGPNGQIKQTGGEERWETPPSIDSGRIDTIANIPVLSEPTWTPRQPLNSELDQDVYYEAGITENGPEESFHLPPQETVFNSKVQDDTLVGPPQPYELTSPSGTPRVVARHDEGRRRDLLRPILLRHFVDHLAQWFDLCDPYRHYESVVPQQARTCPPLMNAILCVSAKHLSKTSHGKVIQQNYDVPAFSDEHAVYFHTRGIKALMELTADPGEIRNEDLLAATILFRWHEEVDAPPHISNNDNDLFLRIMNRFITEQFVTVPCSSRTTSPSLYPRTPNNEASVTEIPSLAANSSSSFIPGHLGPRPDGLRQASFWIAMRQEIYNSFLKQRSFRLPISHCSEFRSFAPAEDAVWANRLIVFCADCIEFFYGSTEIQGDAKTTLRPEDHPFDPGRQSWTKLKELEAEWEQRLPPSFAPIYIGAPNSSRSVIFPGYWYLSDCHVTGLQHLELARILLAIHNPARFRVGLGLVADLKELNSTMQNIVRKLCGMALGNQGLPPAIATTKPYLRY